MINRFDKEKKLKESGLYYQIRNLFIRNGNKIPDKYIMLITDYIDCLNSLDFEGGLFLDPVKVARELPNLLKEVNEEELAVYGVTDNYKITMNSRLDYETNKLFFFHELTHAIQTRMVNNHEECSFYNGHDGMFLTEGATQFTAEILYHLSNGTNLQYRNQPGSVRGLPNHTPYSALSQYQLNGNIIMLMSYSLGIPLNQILALGYRSDGREQIKGLYESFPGNKGKFEELMFDLEKIYTIDKIILAGRPNDRTRMFSERPSLISGERPFEGNIYVENELVNKVERELAANFIENYDVDYIKQNYKKVAMYLTTPELKRDFIMAAEEIVNMSNENVR